jgi:predicted nucleic acid-binding protein
MSIGAVFDTVVLLQAGAKPGGPPGACLRLVLEGKVALYTSQEGFEELADVLGREAIRARFPLLTSEHVSVFLAGLRGKAQVVPNVPSAFRSRGTRTTNTSSTSPSPRMHGSSSPETTTSSIS